MKRFVALAVSALLLSACAPKKRQARKAEGNYDIGAPGAGWEAVKPGGADFAWFHSELGASIYTDSNCLVRFDDSPLSRLTDGMVFGVAEGEPLRDEERSIDGRAGLLRAWDGRLDGVPVRIGVAVLKKDRCVYDLTLLAPPDGFAAGWDAFERVLAGFATHGR